MTAVAEPEAGAPVKVPGEVDLDAAMGELDLTPVPMRMGGIVHYVRRDLTQPEIDRYWAHAAAKEDAQCLAILCGDTGRALNDTLDTLPAARTKLALRRIMETAGLIDAAGGRQGEPAAS